MRRAAWTVLATALALVPAGAAHASGFQESTFQDDRLLLRQPAAKVAGTLDTLAGLGVDRIRATVAWRSVAPAPDDDARPAVDLADPAVYPAAGWTPYDRLVRFAAERRLGVTLVLTSPAPDWATGSPRQTALDPTFDPRADDFGRFVHAVAQRYSGGFTGGGAAPLPRVTSWGIWDEPNQPSSLTPQWAQDPRDPKALVESSPIVYRALVDAAWAALQATGHDRDTILVGETAPKGALDDQGVAKAVDPLRFLRELYCVDENLQFLQGTSAELRGCPVADQAARFPADHPGLFGAAGWAHHPYELELAPGRSPQHEDRWVTLGNLGELTRVLRRVRQRYGLRLVAGGFPLHLTRYGYRTMPPDPVGVSVREQAEFLNQAEYLAWRQRNVRTLAQLPLVDDATPLGSGLVTRDGRRKPAYDAYALPVWLPDATVRRGSRLRVWGLVRPAPNGVVQRVSVQVRARGTRAFTRIATVRTAAPRGYLAARVAVRRSGDLRLAWTSAGGRVRVSRIVSFRVTGP